MTKLLAITAALALLAVAIPPAAAASLTDDPNVPNCSIFGAHDNCEWVAVTGKSILTNGSTGRDCAPWETLVPEGGAATCECVKS